MTEGRAEEAKAEGGYRGLAPYFTSQKHLNNLFNYQVNIEDIYENICNKKNTATWT